MSEKEALELANELRSKLGDDYIASVKKEPEYHSFVVEVNKRIEDYVRTIGWVYEGTDYGYYLVDPDPYRMFLYNFQDLCYEISERKV